MASSVTTAVPAFMAICQAALPDGFQVTLGASFDPRVSPQTLLITRIPFTMDGYAELGPSYRHEEHYNITCSLCSAYGNNDEASRLQEVYGLYDDIQVAVAQNMNLSNTVRLGWCRQLAYTPGRTAQGFTAGQLDFEVEVQARVPSLS